jgi:O-antigen/teichoic acid export membrane protein
MSRAAGDIQAEKSPARGRRLLVFDSVAGVAAQATALVALLVMTPYELAGMGYQAYSVVVLATATASYITLFDLGGAWPVMRFIPRFRSLGQDEYAEEAFTVALTTSLAVGALGCLFVWMFAPELSAAFHVDESARSETIWAVRIAGVSLVPMLGIGVLSGAGRAVGRFKTAAVISAATVISMNVLWLMIARTTRSAPQVVAAQLLVSTLALVSWAIVLRRDSQSAALRLPRTKSVAISVIKFSALNSLSQLGLMFLTTVAIIVVSSAVGAAHLPYFSISLSIAQRVTIISASFAAVAFPRLSEAKRIDSAAKVAGDLDLSHLIITVSTVGICTVIVWAGSSALSIWISPAFAGHSAATLAVLAVGFGVVSLSSLYQINMEANGFVTRVACINVVSGLGGAVLCFILARHVGVFGGAVGVMFGLLCLSITLILASIAVTGDPSRVTLRWTLFASILLVGSGGAMHLLIQATMRAGSGRSWVDVLVTSAVTGATGAGLIWSGIQKQQVSSPAPGLSTPNMHPGWPVPGHRQRPAQESAGM